MNQEPPPAQGPVDVNVRERFEAWIKAPPFERRCMRWPDDTPGPRGQEPTAAMRLSWRGKHGRPQ